MAGNLCTRNIGDIDAQRDYQNAAPDKAVFRTFLGRRRLGRIHNLDAFAQRFAGWCVPYLHVRAARSDYTEWISGCLRMLGLFTGLALIPLMFNMLVAIVKVKIREITGIDDFVEMEEALQM